MKAAPTPAVEGNDFVFHGLYQSLPVGAAFVDSDRKVFAANRKMRAYFPMLSGRQEGLPICQIVRCQQFLDGADPYGRHCKGCVLFRALTRILCEEKPMEEEKWKHVHLCGRGNHRLVRWFSVSGNPVSFCGKLYAVLFLNDITEPTLKEEILRKKLRLDPQTGILNKVSLLRSLDAFLHTERRGPLAVCMIDFDDFKSINDRYGHLMGDKVLDAFCRIARENIRAGDLFGRFGGEEFLFILKTDQRQAVSILKRIQFNLRKAFFGVLVPPATFSAGVVCREGASCQGDTPSCDKNHRGWKELVKEADRLLYRAKANGKNQIACPEIKLRRASRKQDI